MCEKLKEAIYSCTQQYMGLSFISKSQDDITHRWCTWYFGNVCCNTTTV